MKLPKRVPWSNTTQVEQLYAWIYATEEDAAAKVLAVNRLAAWKASTMLPHALESTLSLLVVILQDEDYSNFSTPHSSTLALRQSYSLSLIRLVNGLVDPLQKGAYARPIASIAAQIGLPLWLVELRHASTHEELPSLELLRDGAREAMSWLLRNYFLPTLSPANQSPTASITLSPISPVLSRYKQLLKITTRDASLKSRSKSELVKILQDIEQWISEARVAASMVSPEINAQNDEEDERERWALEQLCDALTGRGGLVPVSKKKRPSPLQGLTVPIPQHIALWSPLILHVYSRYPSFSSILLSRILVLILSSSKPTTDTSATKLSGGDTPPADPTYVHTLASWALWIVDRCGDDPHADCERGEVIKELLLGLGQRDNQTARALLAALAASDPRLEEDVSLLSTSVLPSNRVSEWRDGALETMSERLSSLHPASGVQGSHALHANLGLQDVEMSTPSDPSSKTSIDNSVVTVRGWKLLDESHGWKPCPIGVFNRTDS